MTCFRPLILIAASCLSTPSALAGPEEDAKAWFTRLVAEAGAGFKERSFKITFIMQPLELSRPEDVAAIRERVKALPEHPDRSKLERFERISKHGPEVYRFNMWFRFGEMRLNRDEPSGTGLGYSDFVDLKDRGWSMAPQQLFVLSDRTNRPQGHDLTSAGEGHMGDVGEFFGASVIPFALAASPTFHLDANGRWRAAGSYESPVGTIAMELRGSWDSSAGAGRCEESLARNSKSGDRVVYRVTASQFQPASGLDLELARLVTIEQDGRPWRRLVLEAVEPLDKEAFDAVTPTPTIDGIDAIRGPVTFTQLSDLSGSAPRFQIREEAGSVRELTYEQTVPGHQRSVVRTLGWCAAVALVALIVLLRVRARTT